MADIIMPSHPYQSETYPEEEWAWRGIVDPSLARCGSPRDELLHNYSFDCGTAGWHFDPNYPATITDNGDGSIHLVANSNYGSVVPDKQIFPTDEYVLTIEVANVVGNGKMSIRNQNNQWFNLEYFDTDGTYTTDYNGNIKDIHCGASNDTNFSCDFLSYSLMKKVDYCKPRNGELVSNYTFYCDGISWETFNADATYGNSQATVVRTGLSGSIRQTIYLEAGKTYRLETDIVSTDSSSFISMTKPSGGTEYPIDYLDAGIHSSEYTAPETGNYMVGVGVNSPNGSSAKFNYLSVREVVLEVLTTDSGDSLTTDTGEELTT